MSMKYTVNIRSIEQLVDFKAERVYLPLSEVLNNIYKVQHLVQSGINIVPELPRICTDKSTEFFVKNIEFLKNAGITSVLINSIGYASSAGCFEIIGDYGLNAFNSSTLNVLYDLGIRTQTVSFELTLPQIRDLKGSCKKELFIYGRLPLMCFENCLLTKTNCKNSGISFKKQIELTDNAGFTFPVLCDFNGECKNSLVNSKILWLADKLSDIKNIDFGRFYFTTETKEECADILKKYQNGEASDNITRGLYYKRK